MMYSNNNKKAAQGVGTLIIFIALILVAAVAAAVLITTASSLQSSSLNVGNQAEEKLLTSFDVVQIQAADTSDGVIEGGTDSYAVRVRLGSGSVPIKLEDFTATVDTNDNSQVLSYTNENATVSAFNVTYLTNGGTALQEGYLQSGELIELNVPAESNVSEREELTLTLLTTGGSPLPVDVTTPSVMITQSTTLYP
ncbi:MAG: archaellin/type IV pilin N-terminal domain-containing protein [Candidatus Nanoarchaeia archaeon]